MGLQADLGKKFWRAKAPGLTLGVRGSLFLAFAVIAGMALVISAGASLMLGQLGGMMSELSGRDIPRLSASLQLSAQSASLSTQGQALLASESEAALAERTAQMQATQRIVGEKLAEIARLGADKSVLDAMTETSKNIGDMVGSIGSAARERLETSALREAQAAALRKAHGDFLSAATLAMLDAQTQMNAILGSANFSQSDALDAARAVDLLGNIVTDTNLMASGMTAGLAATSSDALAAAQEAFEAKKKSVTYKLGELRKGDAGETVREPFARLAALAEGKTGVFKVRQKELDANDYGQLIVEETRKLNRGLDISVKQLVDGVQAETAGLTGLASQRISLATMVMLVLGALTLVGSALFVWLYVGRSILARIRMLSCDGVVLVPVGLPSTYAQRDADGNGVPDATCNVSNAIIQGVNESPWIKSSVSANLVYNTIDDTKNPHYGIYANLGSEFAGLGGDAKFYKFTARASVYQTLSDELDIVGVLSGGAGYISSYGDKDLRIFDQFQNNDRMIRGFEYNGIGPVAARQNGDGFDHIGGTTYFNASAEAQFPLPLVPESLGLRGAVFADAATLYGSEVAGALGTDMKLRASAGVGLLWASPFGPLRIDYAIPLKKEDTDKTQEFNFGISTRF